MGVEPFRSKGSRVNRTPFNILTAARRVGAFEYYWAMLLKSYKI